MFDLEAARQRALTFGWNREEIARALLVAQAETFREANRMTRGEIEKAAEAARKEIEKLGGTDA